MDRGFFVLHELRLASGDDAAGLRAAARLAGMPQAVDEQVLPLLVNIDDHRDVACVRHVRVLPEVGDDAGLRIQIALAPEPAGGEPPRYYRERAAVSGELPTLGVCLGGQLLAVANGGQVAPNPDGPEFGAQLIAKRAASANDPLFGPLPITPDVIQWHFDAINSLPPGALQLASSPGCAVQAFRLGRLAWGIQFHIETTPEIVRGWAATDARALEGYDVQRLLSHADGVHDDLAEVWAPFATSFADVVRDPAAVRASRAVPTSTAEPITDPAAIRAALAAELTASRGATVAPLPGLRQPGHD